MFNLPKCFILFILFILLNYANPVFAERVHVQATISSLITYSEQGVFDGDIAIKISNPPTGCEGGFWLRSADTVGYKNITSFLLSAYHSKSQVSLSGLSHELWTGSGAKFCRLDQVSLI